MPLQTKLNKKLLALLSYTLILLIASIPWWVEYVETGQFFQTQGDFIANLTSSFLNLSITFLLLYLFTQSAKINQSQNFDLERLLAIDHLTQIYNSRFFHQQLAKEIERASRQKEVFSLLFLDIDRFKKYNDSKGHTAGDEVLKDLGKIIKRMIREKVDCGARYGGDEFCVILIDSDLQAAYEIGERIRLAFYQCRNENISLSMGIAAFRKGDSSDSLFKRADSAMYQAKRRGGNRTEVELGNPPQISRYEKTA
jgi:diguanylate cyclase (GGDEF)-like protein